MYFQLQQMDSLLIQHKQKWMILLMEFYVNILRMEMIRMDSIQITDKIHMDQLRSLDMVDMDMWGGVEMEKRPNDEGFIDSHNMFIDISFFESTVIEYVEKNHPLDVDRIVKGWEIPSYNLLKGLNLNGIGGDRRCDYVVKVDKDGWVQSIVIMTERNCGFVLKLLLEMVRTGQSNV